MTDNHAQMHGRDGKAASQVHTGHAAAEGRSRPPCDGFDGSRPRCLAEADEPARGILAAAMLSSKLASLGPMPVTVARACPTLSCFTPRRWRSTSGGECSRTATRPVTLRENPARKPSAARHFSCEDCEHREWSAPSPVGEPPPGPLPHGCVRCRAPAQAPRASTCRRPRTRQRVTGLGRLSHEPRSLALGRPRQILSRGSRSRLSRRICGHRKRSV
jgi:hypothetical protein